MSSLIKIGIKDRNGKYKNYIVSVSDNVDTPQDTTSDSYTSWALLKVKLFLLKTESNPA